MRAGRERGSARHRHLSLGVSGQEESSTWTEAQACGSPSSRDYRSLGMTRDPRPARSRTRNSFQARLRDSLPVPGPSSASNRRALADGSAARLHSVNAPGQRARPTGRTVLEAALGFVAGRARRDDSARSIRELPIGHRETPSDLRIYRNSQVSRYQPPAGVIPYVFHFSPRRTAYTASSQVRAPP